MDAVVENPIDSPETSKTARPVDAGASIGRAALSLSPAALAFLLVGAHFLRLGALGLAVTCALLPALVAFRAAWVPKVFRMLLAGAAILWVVTALSIAQTRLAEGAPYLRMLFILGGVALFTAGAAWLAGSGAVKALCSGEAEASTTSAATFILAMAGLACVQHFVPRPMLLLERFLPGWGWLEVLALSTYAAFVAGKLWDPKVHALWRRRVWLLFSAVFFGQLLLGLSGFERFLMTGKLHVPVPALILAGPVFRGDGLFMPILFFVTLLLVGPAWCSHLCYIGAWDNALAAKVRRPSALPRWARGVRWGILAGIMAVAMVLRILGVPGPWAAAAALLFGAVGVGVMFFWSRRSGTMAHCTMYCPAGLAADLLGRLSPFRLRINSACTDCMVCARVCRYDALNPIDIKNRRPALSCSLCGDCVPNCHAAAIEYRFLGLSPGAARGLFTVLAVALHAIFMGVARI